MKYLFSALCWAILIGGTLAACAKKPKPTARPEPVAPISMEGRDLAMPDTKDVIEPSEPTETPEPSDN